MRLVVDSVICKLSHVSHYVRLIMEPTMWKCGSAGGNAEVQVEMWKCGWKCGSAGGNVEVRLEMWKCRSVGGSVGGNVGGNVDVQV